MPDASSAVPAGKFDRSVSLLAWAYNEEALVGSFLARADRLLRETVADYEILLVDDGSKDRTLEIARHFAVSHPRLRILRVEPNQGACNAFRLAIRNASKQYLFWQTIDWSYDISNLRRFLELLKSSDIVVGARRAPVKLRASLRILRPLAGLLRLSNPRHITKRSDTLPKAVVSIGNYLLVRFLFRLPISDYQNLAFYPTKLIQSFRVESESSFGSPELLLKAYSLGCSFVEVPISFIARTAGEAKGTRPAAILRSISDILGFWFRWTILRKRPGNLQGTMSRLVPGEWELTDEERAGLGLRRSRRQRSPSTRDMVSRRHE